MSATAKVTVSATAAGKIITSRGYAIRKDLLSEAAQQSLRADLLMAPKVKARGIAGAPPFPIYMESRTRYYLPRAWAVERYGDAEVNLVGAGAALSSAVAFVGQPYEYQTQIIDAFLAAGSGLLCVPCGKGKTFMAINIAVQLGRRFLIVVDKEFLLNQWRGELERFAPQLRIGILQAGKAEVATADYDCTICMIQTLCSRDYPDGFFEDYGFTIFDECHHLGAAHFSKALQKIQTRFLLGLSATPTREDGMTAVFEAFLGKPVYWERVREADPSVMVRAVHYDESEVDGTWRDVPTDWRGETVMAKLLGKIVESPRRTRRIFDLIVELCAEPTRQILILSERKVLLHALEDMLKMTTIKYGYYIGGMKEAALEKSATEAQVLLATYSMASDALNIKTLNCVILASPRKNVEQATGRILRQRISERTIDPVIVDIIDVHQVYLGMWRKRAAYYKQCAYKIRHEREGEAEVEVVANTIEAPPSNECLIKLPSKSGHK
jgi:superfamily II DNA or RNA helicase